MKEDLQFKVRDDLSWTGSLKIMGSDTV